MNLKEIFDKAENGALTYDQFIALATGAKFVDLSEGNYVSKSKFDDEIAAKDSQINTLNSTITTRDADLETLKQQLSTESANSQSITQELANLQARYTTDAQNYQAQLQKQAYEFAVKDFANNKQFTSKAAKRDFINSMIAKDLKMDSGKILGAEDFVTAYSTENADAFVVAESQPTPKPLPKFVDSTPGADNTPDPAGGFKFNFIGVRTNDKK